MQPNILFNSILGALGVITYTQAVPIEVIYSGDTCDCPKKLNYELNMPTPPIPSEHSFKVESPIKTLAKITYGLDFDVEQAAPKLTESKSNIFAEVDRVTPDKKDDFKNEELPKTCGSSRCGSGSRYVLSENSSARLTHPNSLASTQLTSKTPPGTQMMAIFLKPFKQPIWDVSKTRNKRDISRIFRKPRKNVKRSDRLVKQYNKRLKDIAARDRTFFKQTEKPIGSKSLAAASNRLRPFKQWSSFFALPNFRKKRDIKGEYDLIEKDRAQMDLTLPDIIQYMPETLDPNFQRYQCSSGSNCLHTPLTETTTMTTPLRSEKTATTFTNQSKSVPISKTLNATESNASKEKGKDKTQTAENVSSSTNKKRNTFDYAKYRCPLVIDAYNPTSSTGFTYQPQTGFESFPSPVSLTNNPHGLDPIAQQHVEASYNPHVSTIISNDPILTAVHAKPTVFQLSNAQLDQFISAIIHKHADFLKSSVQTNKGFVESPEEHELDTKYFLKNLLAGPWTDGSLLNKNVQQQPDHYHPKVHSHLPHYHGPNSSY